MPLAIPQQVLSQPVTNYYKGKAMRQELAMSEKKEELLDLNIEAAKNPPVDPKEQRDAENHMKDSLAESFAAAEMIRQKGGNESEWTEAFNNSLSTSTNPEVLAEAVRLYDKNGDKILGPNELDQGVAFAISRGQELQEESGEDSPYAKINPKDFTPESVAEFERTGSYSSLQKAAIPEDQPDFEPVTKNEVDAAMAIVKSDPQLADIDTKNEKIVAAQFIANETRQLQANESLPYDEAVAMAAAKLKAKLKKDDDYFTPKEEKLNIAEDPRVNELQYNEYLIDGTVWVEEPDGSIRPRD